MPVIRNAFSLFRVNGFYISCLLLFCIFSDANSVEWLLESDLVAQVGYNDNLFLVDDPGDAIATLSVAPSLRFLAREEHWETYLDARIRSNNYSDEVVDSVDKFLEASGSYRSERNIYSLKGVYSLVSNLNRESPDFGLATQNVQTERYTISPDYTRLIAERLTLFINYNHTDVDFINAENTGFVPYITDTITGSVIYNLTEKDDISLILQATDYSSKNDALEYQLFITRLGIEHYFTELWSMDLSIGGSRRNSTNRLTQTFDFFGQPITVTEETDFRNDGYVLDASVIRLLEKGSVSGGISRDNVTNSQGGLNEVSRIVFSISERFSELWRYSLLAKYEEIDAVSVIERTSDRDLFFFDANLFYTLGQRWRASISYKYTARKFKSDLTDNRAPHSNAVLLGVTYNIPSLSTY